MHKPPAVVVFDVNIYVDLAGLVAQPFTWEKLEAAVASHWNDPVPHPTNAALDSARAVLMSRTGSVGTGEPLEVWTSEHIDKLVISKVADVAVDATGASWTREAAVDFHYEVMGIVFEDTGGASIGRVLDPVNNPPLDYEDGCVMRTAVDAGDSEKSPRYCITRDREFRTEYANESLEATVEVMYPHEWVDALRRARRPDPSRLMGARMRPT